MASSGGPPSAARIESLNFRFLEAVDPALAAPVAQAERYLDDDPAVAIGKMRLFAERAAKRAAAELGVYVDERGDFVETLRTLSYRRAFDERVAGLFNAIRKDGNRAVHDGAGDRATAVRDLGFALKIAEWLYRVAVDASFRSPSLVVPPRREDEARKLESAKRRIAELEAETEKLRREEALRFEARLAELKAASAAPDSPEIRQKTARAFSFAVDMDLDEGETRAIIDQQLRDAGWEADTERLKYSLGARPEKGKDKAIAEWPCEGGRADYLLFRGLEPIAVVEAKRAERNVPAVLDQAEKYARSIEGGAPFAFATNGRPYLAQLAEASGIWFRDLRSETNHPRALEGWYSPEGLSALRRRDAATAAKALDDFGFELDFPLRYYQRDAILAAERAIREGKRSALLAMATGTGKTKTCVALLYRLLSSGMFRRALFLVDRNALGEQAGDAFKETKIRGLRSFADDFGIKEPRQGAPDIETRVAIATVQSMVQRVLSADGQDRPTVDEYDLVVVDECHRGYLLDRELSDDELEFRSYEDYVSKYRRVIDYFDAARIGMTATPAPQTTDIFGEPVYYYSYRQAVIDGCLVDHRPPVVIETKLSKEGIAWKAGEEVPVYRPERGQIELFRTPDELAFDVSEFNKKVVTRPFNKVVCEHLAVELDPFGDRKTLVFCATDMHADIVVEELTAAFEARYGEIPNDTVKKITGAATEPMTLFRRYRNERLPNVAVTVDLLTTGIDVPAICSIVFLRRVNSRLLYDQMLGRATRLCDEIGKDCFTVYDAVGLYDSMSGFTDMKPVVVNPSIGFAQLMREIEGAAEMPPAAARAARNTAYEQFMAKLRRKAARMSEEEADKFESVAGSSPKDFVAGLAAAGAEGAAALLSKSPKLGDWLDRVGAGMRRPLVVSDHPDELASVKRKYFIADNAQDYLEKFKAYIETHRNEIAALRAVTTKPSSLTRKDLRSLLASLDEEGFAESSLREAWKDATNADVAASILGFIRRQALGDPLLPWDERVNKALAKIKAAHRFTPPQAQWLERIAKQLKAELVVDRSVLDQGAFRDQGGFDRINRIFGGSLESTLEEMAELLWQA
jgi:type I restriction enzyme R subunit